MPIALSSSFLCFFVRYDSFFLVFCSFYRKTIEEQHQNNQKALFLRTYRIFCFFFCCSSDDSQSGIQKVESLLLRNCFVFLFSKFWKSFLCLGSYWRETKVRTVWQWQNQLRLQRRSGAIHRFCVERRSRFVTQFCLLQLKAFFIFIFDFFFSLWKKKKHIVRQSFGDDRYIEYFTGTIPLNDTIRPLVDATLSDTTRLVWFNCFNALFFIFFFRIKNKIKYKHWLRRCR